MNNETDRGLVQPEPQYTRLGGCALALEALEYNIVVMQGPKPNGNVAISTEEGSYYCDPDTADTWLALQIDNRLDPNPEPRHIQRRFAAPQSVPGRVFSPTFNGHTAEFGKATTYMGLEHLKGPRAILW